MATEMASTAPTMAASLTASLLLFAMMTVLPWYGRTDRCASNWHFAKSTRICCGGVPGLYHTICWQPLRTNMPKKTKTVFIESSQEGELEQYPVNRCK
jgi:hypothetical protein